MLDTIRSIENSKKLKIITIDLEVICAVSKKRDQSAGEIFSKVRSSNASFYATLNKLIANSVLVKNSDLFDRRVIRYNLHSSFENFIEIFSDNLKQL
jgi:hypothetical protein